MATKKTAAEDSMLNIVIPEIELNTLTVKIVGDSPLIVHAWSEKAKKMMLDKQMKKATKGREAKDPERDFFDSLYWLTERPEKPTMEDIQRARFGFPTIAIKACAIDAGYQQGLIPKKTTARGAFRILGEYAEIDGLPTPREDMCMVGGMSKVADIRYRGEFKKWSITLTIQYNPNVISAEQICALLNIGGFSCGIGEWRVGRNGNYGCFHVARNGE